MALMENENFVRQRRELAKRPVGELIDLLASEELPIRFIAEMCLRDATST